MTRIAFIGLGIMGAPMAAVRARGGGDLNHTALLTLVEEMSGRGPRT